MIFLLYPIKTHIAAIKNRYGENLSARLIETEKYSIIWNQIPKNLINIYLDDPIKDLKKIYIGKIV